MRLLFKYPRFLLCAACFLAGPVMAGGTYQPAKNGCMIWNSDVQPNESIEYDGRCEKGYAQGVGLAKWFIGDVLNQVWEGNFSKGLLVGVVVVSSKAGQYIGQFSEGDYNGQGQWVQADGTQYQGEFKNGKPDGRGFIKFKNGQTYQGEFRHGKRHGRGELIGTSGWRYQGEMSNDAITGVGTMYFEDGGKYTGNFKNGKFHGDGFLFDNQGVLIGKGVFSEGKFVRLADVYLNLDRNFSVPVAQALNFEIPMSGNVNGQRQSLTPSALGGHSWVNVITPSGKVQGGYIWSTNQPGMLGGSTYIQLIK